MDHKGQGLEPLLNGQDNDHKFTNEQLMGLMDQSTIYKDKVEPGQQAAVANDDVNEAAKNLVQKFGYVNGLASGVGSDITRGISGTPADLANRTKRYGDNKPLPRKTKTCCGIVYEQFQDLFVIILCIAALISLVAGVIGEGWQKGWLDGVSILVAVTIITSVNTVNEMSKEGQFQKLMAKGDQTLSTVIRNGITCKIDSSEVVVGDLIEIPKDMRVVADCVLVSANNMECEEADLTGESEPRHKQAIALGSWNEELAEDQPCPFLLKGAVCNQGNGMAIVTTVGISTNQGKAGLTMNFEDDPTPLQVKLEAIVEIIGKIGLAGALMTFIAAIIKMILTIYMATDKDAPIVPDGEPVPSKLWNKANLDALLEAFIISISVVVMAVPEGLPMAVSIAIAFSVSDLQEEGNLVRKPDATETMGGCHFICTDKTGTLTTNIMTVQSTWIAGQRLEGSKHHNPQSEAFTIAQQLVLWNSSAKEVMDANKELKIDGNPTEKAMIKYFKDSHDVSVMDTQNKLGDVIEYCTPFDPKEKYMATCVRKIGGGYRLLIKGAPEQLKVTRQLNEDGSIVDFDQESFNEHRQSYAKKCYRTLGIAFADFSEEEWAELKGQHNGLIEVEDRRKIDNNLIMVAMFGIEDPLRPGIKQAVEDHARAGVRTIMVTGDNLDTAKAIAYQAGILSEDDWNKINSGHRDADTICMRGLEFRQKTEGYVHEKRGDDKDEKDYIVNSHEFNKITKNLKVMARCAPEHKYLLVTGLIEREYVVAVTGDGTNDAPALKRADVGFAMGTGSDAAKDSSKIVLTGDDFCATLATVKFGRNIFDSVRKFLQFQLTINVVAMIVVFLGMCLFDGAILTSVQILWVNLIMDTFAALALATEPPTDDLLLRQPQKRKDSIINAQMWRNIFGWSFAQIIIMFFVLYCGAPIFGINFNDASPDYWRQSDIDANNLLPLADRDLTMVLGGASGKILVYTLAFQTFVFMQLFNQINARKLGRPADKVKGIAAVEEYNVFQGFFNNWLFIIITIGTFAAQFGIVYLGGEFLRVAPLTLNQNMFAFGMGFFMLPWTLLVKKIPSTWFDSIGVSEDAPASGEVSGFSVSRRSMSKKLQKSMEAKIKKTQVEMEQAKHSQL